MAKKTYDITFLNAGKTKIIVEDKKYIYVPITEEWFWDDNIATDEFLVILKAMDIDPYKSRAKNTRKKLRNLIMKKQK